MASARKIRSKKMTDTDLKGLIAPVFTCFKNDESCSLELAHIDRYAQWLKLERIIGVLVNGIIGEGPVLSFRERKLNAEMWCDAATKHDLFALVQVGGAALRDVMDMAQHAEDAGAHAVICLPDIYHRPRTIEQLVLYCKVVANKCSSIPFLYYHAPDFTGVKFDMTDFCARAEMEIPNFLGLQFTCYDLDMGFKCLREGRVVSLGTARCLASAMMLGFDSAAFSFVNGRPKLFWSIYNAMKNNKIELARKRQEEAIEMINQALSHESKIGLVPALKIWFNRMMSSKDGAGFSAGPARKFF